ncbi:MAG: ethylbenzene dehydrogenase-related protein [Rhodospirillales bacterium]|jgi:hypothetical protein|nr:ethylbenzene dehydrogenase-related protein [Rhodospirillales bacterium]MDP6773223.1 ethylbenzene dehydrogenase-related protein [Rhodospirillales bacterium]
MKQNKKLTGWRTSPLVLFAATLGLAFFVSGSAAAADPAAIDWSKISTKTVKLFYPGQSSHQWMRSPAHKRADKKSKAGDSCISCHEDEESEIGDLIATGKKLEPTPPPAKPGSIDLEVQAAYDSKNAYLRFRWKTKNPFPGDAHPHWRFDGKAWKGYGGPRLTKSVYTGQTPPIYEDRLSMMIDDGGVPMFAAQGCWLTCHDGGRDMQGVVSADRVKAHSLLGKVLKKKDVRKYLPASRGDKKSTWDKTKSVEEIARIKAAGGFVDLMQWRAHRSNPIGMADDGYVLEYRLFDAGKKMFFKNKDAKTGLPKFMYDANKVGVKAIRAEDLRVAGKPQQLIEGVNAVPFDAGAGWKEGDLIPEYVLTRAVQGSAGDNNNVKGTWKDGAWTVVWARPMNLNNPDDKPFKDGAVVNVGFAVHDDNITTRGHHVSFSMSLGFGVKADITAVKLGAALGG